jgi:tetratricopeptide (TPR) repeat protein
MSSGLGKILDSDEIESLGRRIVEDAKAGREDAARQAAQRLRAIQHHQPDAARALLRIINHHALPADSAAEILVEIAEAHGRDAVILGRAGECLEAVRDIDDLNAPPPEEPVFGAIIDRLCVLAEETVGRPEQEAVLRGLATGARMLARQHDALAEECYRKLAALRPDDSACHYNLGLFYKTRGRFAEGIAENRIAAELCDETVESYEWNLGICATGAGEGEAALEVWKRMEQIIEMGRFGLPDGRYPQCKVKLAERPLAERDAKNDSPGLEETIWIQRLSPCHGIVRSVLYQDLGVDFGDVILFDDAPITYHTYGETSVPVFPHLATLLRRNYRFFDFAGTQNEAGQLGDISADLSEDALVYSHSENYREICASCWRDADTDHERHERTEKHVVSGRIAAPPHIAPRDLLAEIEVAVAKRAPCQIYMPGLRLAAGDEKQAEVDERRFAMLTGR